MNVAVAWPSRSDTTLTGMRAAKLASRGYGEGRADAGGALLGGLPPAPGGDDVNGGAVEVDAAAGVGGLASLLSSS